MCNFLIHGHMQINSFCTVLPTTSFLCDGNMIIFHRKICKEREKQWHLSIPRGKTQIPTLTNIRLKLHYIYESANHSWFGEYPHKLVIPRWNWFWWLFKVQLKLYLSLKLMLLLRLPCTHSCMSNISSGAPYNMKVYIKHSKSVSIGILCSSYYYRAM